MEFCLLIDESIFAPTVFRMGLNMKYIFLRRMALFSLTALILLGLLPRPAEAETSIVSVPAEAYVLADADTGQILYSKNEDNKAYPASTVKILTCLLALEQCSPDETVIVPKSALDIEAGSAAIYVTPGEMLTMRDCVYALMMASANDIANTIAEHVAGSVSAFVEMMNERARELGAVNTHFTNTHGLHDEDNYTTAADLVLIARAAWEIPEYREILATAQYAVPPTNYCSETRYFNQVHEMRRYLGTYYYKPCLGGKTGYTSAAGYSLVSYAQKEENGMTLLVVVMGCSRSGDQYKATRTLFEYGFENFKAVTQSLKGIYLGQVPVYRDEKLQEKLGYVKVCASRDLIFDVSVHTETSPDFEVRTEFFQNLTYPVSNGTPAGYLHYYLDGRRILSIPCEVMNAEELSPLKEENSENSGQKEETRQNLLPPLLAYILAGIAFVLFLSFLLLLRRHLLPSSRH